MCSYTSLRLRRDSCYPRSPQRGNRQRLNIRKRYYFDIVLHIMKGLKTVRSFNNLNSPIILRDLNIGSLVFTPIGSLEFKRRP